MMTGPLEDLDCLKNPLTRLESNADFLTRRDEQLKQLKLSEISENELKSADTQDAIFQLAIKSIRDVNKLKSYITREAILETKIANSSFDTIFDIIKKSGVINDRKTTVKAMSQVMNPTVVVDRNGKFISLKTTKSGKVKPTANPEWLKVLCIRRKMPKGDRMITDGNAKLQRLIEVNKNKITIFLSKNHNFIFFRNFNFLVKITLKTHTNLNYIITSQTS
jgi:hypothetical protein